MKKTIWTFGLISGGILSGLMLLTMLFVDAIGYDRGVIIGYTTMVLAFMLVFPGIRSYRDNVAGGTIGFGRALAIGSLIALVASTCYVATWELIYFKLAPDFATSFQASVEKEARTRGGSPEEVQKRVAEAQKFG